MYIDSADISQTRKNTAQLNKAFSNTIKMLNKIGLIKDWTVIGEIARGYQGYPHDYPCSPLTCGVKSPFTATKN